MSFLLSIFIASATSAMPSQCPRGSSEVATQYPKNRPYTRVNHRNPQRQNYSVCWGVFAPVDTIECFHYMERPCVSANAAAVCGKERDESRRVQCLALSANKDYEEDELEECRDLIWSSRAECMEERGRPND